MRAVHAALAAEHAAVYGYGVAGARLSGEQREEALAAYNAHRARRNALQRAVRDLGGEPDAAAPAYALPFSVADAGSATRLAAEIEDRIAAVYADMVMDTRGDLRMDAAGALREAAVRAVRWRGRSVAFPGLDQGRDALPSVHTPAPSKAL